MLEDTFIQINALGNYFSPFELFTKSHDDMQIMLYVFQGRFGVLGCILR